MCVCVSESGTVLWPVNVNRFLTLVHCCFLPATVHVFVLSSFYAYFDIPIDIASFLCSLLVYLKVFEEQLVLSLDDEEEDYPSSLSGNLSSPLLFPFEYYSNNTVASGLNDEWVIHIKTNNNISVAVPNNMMWEQCTINKLTSSEILSLVTLPHKADLFFLITS